jgi:hypothetical protein
VNFNNHLLLLKFTFSTIFKKQILQSMRMWCGNAVINRFMEISQKLNVGVVLNECDRNGLRGEMLWKKNHTYIINIDAQS